MSRLVDLRRSVVRIAEVGRNSVTAVRDAFQTGETPFQGATSGSVSNYLDSFVSDRLGSELIKGTAHFGLATSRGGTVLQPPKPELDEAAVIEDRERGVLDQFTVRLTVSIPEPDAQRARTIRILRADLGPIRAPRPTFGALLDSTPASGKSSSSALSAAKRIGELGVPNLLTSFVGADLTSPGLSVTAPAERQLSEPVPPRNTNRDRIPTGLLSIEGVDRSVLENVTFYLNRRAIGDVPEPPRSALIPNATSGINVLKGAGVSTGGTLVQTSNVMEFISIGTVSPGSPGSRTVGSVIEMDLVDPSVVYGAAYAYYAATVGDNGELGPRSRIVNVSISKAIPPAAPDVTYSFTGGAPRFLIRCPSRCDHVEVFRSGRAALISAVMGSDQALIIQEPSGKVGDFYHVGDLGLGPDGSTCFIDRDVSPGDRVTYRFYAVDPYGLKSQTPFTCEMRIPGPGDRIPLGIPSITTEQVRAGEQSVRVSVNVDDDRIVGFVFSRKDITIGERSVHQANQPELVSWGATDPKRAGSRRGPTPLDLEWPSIIMSTQGSASFIDSSVRIDRVYQYGVYGIDVRGNRTFLVGAQPVGVYSKPTIDPPTDFKVTLSMLDREPVGVLLSWTPGTVDFSPNDLLEDQDVLAATAVRSAFQVERRQKGAPFWDAMPATTESYFLDPILSNNAPAFRPPYAVKGLDYEYRVLAMQSGGFVSPRTDPISISVSPPPTAPTTIWVRSSSVAVRPLVVVVSWDMPSDFIDHWEVQRAATNKIFGLKISSMDSVQARSLTYQTIAKMTPEASRAAGLKRDISSTVDRSIYVGRRFYVDSDVDPSNCYFYRVCSVGKGVSSDWTYGGIQLLDHAFDRKLLSTISDDTKLELASDERPIMNAITTVGRVKGRIG